MQSFLSASRCRHGARVGGWVLHRPHYVEALQPQDRFLASFFPVCRLHLGHQLLKRCGGRPAQLQGGEFDEAPHRFLPARGDHEVFRGAGLLQHPPLHLHVVARVAPVAQRIEVAHVEAILQAFVDAGQTTGRADSKCVTGSLAGAVSIG